MRIRQICNYSIFAGVIMDLNVEQSKLVEADPNGLALIKGIAGSGKTTVALHRALFLHRNYCNNPDDRILLATFNRTLVNR